MNIGISAGLLDHTMGQIIIKTTDVKELKEVLKSLENDINDLQKKHPKVSLIIAGASLTTIQENPDLQTLFVDGAVITDVVLACRVSPAQKAQIVEMVRNKFPTKTSLAIGDGANDVSMILKAHVGVGILGKEGS